MRRQVDQNVNCVIYPVQVRVLADSNTTKRLAGMAAAESGREMHWGQTGTDTQAGTRLQGTYIPD